MKGNITAIGNDLALVGTGAGTDTKDALDKADAAKSSIDLVPSNSAGTRSAGWNYKSPFTTNGATTNVASTLPDYLGSTAVADATTNIYLAYYELEAGKQAVNGIATSADTFGSEIGNFNGAVDGVRTTVDDLAKGIEDSDTLYKTIIDITSSIFSIFTVVLTAFFGVIVGLGILGILGAILMAFCDKYKCRYLIYFSCCILFLIGIVGFLIAIILSIVVPAIFWSCAFISFSLESPANFKSNILS